MLLKLEAAPVYAAGFIGVSTKDRKRFYVVCPLCKEKFFSVNGGFCYRCHKVIPDAIDLYRSVEKRVKYMQEGK